MLKEFTKFPSLENTYRQKEIDKIVMMEIKDQWVVTEKVHGANFSFWVYKNVFARLFTGVISVLEAVVVLCTCSTRCTAQLAPTNSTTA